MQQFEKRYRNEYTCNDGISQSGIEALEVNGFNVITTNVAQEQLINFINENNVVALLVRSATSSKNLIDACPNLKIIGRGGVGMDNIDVEYAREKAYRSSIHLLLHLLPLLNWYLLTFTVEALYDSNRNMPLEGETGTIEYYHAKS